jgi:hypothetical protein
MNNASELSGRDTKTTQCPPKHNRNITTVASNADGVTLRTGRRLTVTYGQGAPLTVTLQARYSSNRNGEGNDAE